MRRVRGASLAELDVWFTVQELVDGGNVEGLVVGMAKGMAKALLMLLEHRFGPLPEAVVRRVREASLAELDAWFAVALAAWTLADVFGDLVADRA